MAKLIFSRKAGADLRNVYAFSVERFSIGAADDYYEGLKKACERLKEFPEIGPFHPSVSPPVRYLVFRRHHIFYDLVGETVIIMRVLHHAMNASRQLQQ